MLKKLSLLFILPILVLSSCNDADKALEKLIVGEYCNTNNTGTDTSSLALFKGIYGDEINCELKINTGELVVFNKDKSLKTLGMIEFEFSFSEDDDEILIIECNSLFNTEGSWNVKSGLLKQYINADSFNYQISEKEVTGDRLLAEHLDAQVSKFVLNISESMRQDMTKTIVGNVPEIDSTSFILHQKGDTEEDEDSEVLYERMQE